jgi:hypothetical protein
MFLGVVCGVDIFAQFDLFVTFLKNFLVGV